jgi:hypothetical protein
MLFVGGRKQTVGVGNPQTWESLQLAQPNFRGFNMVKMVSSKYDQPSLANCLVRPLVGLQYLLTHPHKTGLSSGNQAAILELPAFHSLEYPDFRSYQPIIP